MKYPGKRYREGDLSQGFDIGSGTDSCCFCNPSNFQEAYYPLFASSVGG
jgi:hypothetical protein